MITICHCNKVCFGIYWRNWMGTCLLIMFFWWHQKLLLDILYVWMTNLYPFTTLPLWIRDSAYKYKWSLSTYVYIWWTSVASLLGVLLMNLLIKRNIIAMRFMANILNYRYLWTDYTLWYHSFIQYSTKP